MQRLRTEGRGGACRAYRRSRAGGALISPVPSLSQLVGGEVGTEEGELCMLMYFVPGMLLLIRVGTTSIFLRR